MSYKVSDEGLFINAAGVRLRDKDVPVLIWGDGFSVSFALPSGTVAANDKFALAVDVDRFLGNGLCVLSEDAVLDAEHSTVSFTNVATNTQKFLNAVNGKSGMVIGQMQLTRYVGGDITERQTVLDDRCMLKGLVYVNGANVYILDPNAAYTKEQADALLEQKMDYPISSGSSGQVLTLTSSGYKWLDPTGGSASVNVDTELSHNSVNPVQNKVITSALDEKASSSHTHEQADISDLADALNGKAATSHTHSPDDVTGLASALNGKANKSHTHAQGDISGLSSALDGKLNAPASAGTVGQVLTVTSGGVAWDSVPLPDLSQYYTSSQVDTALSSKANTSHTHEQADVSGLSSALEGKANSSHTHAQADVSGLSSALSGKVDSSALSAYYTSSQVNSALSGKANASHTHSQGDVSGLSSALDGKLNAPASVGTVGQVLTVTSGGYEWKDAQGGSTTTTIRTTSDASISLSDSEMVVEWSPTSNATLSSVSVPSSGIQYAWEVRLNLASNATLTLGSGISFAIDAGGNADSVTGGAVNIMLVRSLASGAKVFVCGTEAAQ